MKVLQEILLYQARILLNLTATNNRNDETEVNYVF